MVDVTVSGAKAKDARLRIDSMRKLLSDALEAISGPDPDWARCSSLLDMAEEIAPVITVGERL